MPEDGSFKFSKAERLCSRKEIDRLFSRSGSHSMVAFPLRMVYMSAPAEPEEPSAKILISVPKRCFKRAVKRNRVKRQVREAYRKHKPALAGSYMLAFIWLDDKLWNTDSVERKVASLLHRLNEKERQHSEKERQE